LPKREPAGITIALVVAGATYSGWLVSSQRGRSRGLFGDTRDRWWSGRRSRFGTPRCSGPRLLSCTSD